MSMPLKNNNGRLEPSWSWEYGDYYIDRAISNLVGKLIWIKMVHKWTESIEREAFMKRISHQKIQQAKKDWLLPQWIESIDLIWTPAWAKRRWNIYQEHARGKTFDDSMLDDFWKDLFWRHDVGHVITPWLERTLQKIGIDAWWIHQWNIIVDEVCAHDLIIFFQDNVHRNLDEFESRWIMYINIDVGMWSLIER